MPAMGAFASVLFGLALVGCGDDGTEPTTSVAETSMSTTMTSDPTDTDSGTSTGTGSATAAMTETAEASDYGSPGVSTDIESSGAPEESSEGSTDDTGTGSTGTDTGASTTDTGTAEGADYGAAPPRD